MDKGNSGSLKSDINVTPLVDVMLVVLIIFMVVTPLLQKGVSVTLPQARNVSAVPENENQVATVVIKEDGQLYLGNAPVDETALLDGLKLKFASNPGLQFQIKADRDVHYGVVKRIVRLGREAGFSGAAMIAEEIKK